MAYYRTPAGLPALGWLPSPLNCGPGAYPLDMSGSQNFARAPMGYYPEPFPWNWVTPGVAALRPLFGTFQVVPPVAPGPESGYLGGNGINVTGGMSFGFPDWSALVKE